MIRQIRSFAIQHLSRETRRRIAYLAAWPPVGWIRFGQLRRLRPFTTDYGNSRGLEIDRYYIETFLSAYSSDIQGHVLEIKHNVYTIKYGGDRVTQSDVLHKVEGNRDATIIADLSSAPHIPANTFDSIIFTQTLQFIYDIKSTIATLYRILKPGGVVLATCSGMAQISREDYKMWGEYWRFTSLSARYLFEESFPKEKICVCSYGNVLSSISFLEGLAAQDLRKSELDMHDPDYELIVAIRAVKPEKSA